VADVAVTVAGTADAFAARFRQAATGCTIHPHGPLNALAAIIAAHHAGTVDGHAVFDAVIDRCRRQLETLPIGSIEAQRESKVLTVADTMNRGLLP